MTQLKKHRNNLIIQNDVKFIDHVHQFTIESEWNIFGQLMGWEFKYSNLRLPSYFHYNLPFPFSTSSRIISTYPLILCNKL